MKGMPANNGVSPKVFRRRKIAFWVAVGQCSRFLQGQAFDQFDGALARAVAFVDVRRTATEGQAQARQ